MKEYQEKVCYTSNHPHAISMQRCTAMDFTITVSNINSVCQEGRGYEEGTCAVCEEMASFYHCATSMDFEECHFSL